jgi:hypothetical protein
MLIHTAPQGSEVWHKARAGVITASMFATCREKLKSGPNKGKPSAAAESYAFRLAVERISGLPLDEGFETWAMRRGHELEPEARTFHEGHAGVIVDIAGFVTTDCGLFGASADGLIGEDGGAEYKCLISPERIKNAILRNDLDEFIDQVQGGMWITGRAWWDFCIYCPALSGVNREFSRWRIRRDDDYIVALEKDLSEFNNLVVEYQERLAQSVAA